ncbi:MAG: murein biosynthesis integral membrane protein MurJ [Deltaproteobacteria bacterium]|nr:murein biosynthesis integral membrane protein MurJ [Deltaproteobacteria bacterium]
MSEDKSKIARAAGVVGGATLMSRILGFVRDAFIANLFGAGMAADAFFVAFRIPNMFRRLLGEGSLTSSFIPVFTEYLTRKSREEARDMANAFFSLAMVVLSLVTVAGIIFAPQIVTLLAHGFTSIPEKFTLTVILTRMMFPYLFFVGLVALCMGILNSLRHFAAPALSPVLLNISIILSVLAPFFKEPVMALAIGVLIGGVSQLSLQLPFLWKNGMQIKLQWKPGHPGVVRVGWLMAPSIIGLAVTQINVLVDTIVASFLKEGTVSYLYYADRLLEFPMGIFAIAIATAVLPAMSEKAAKNDMPGVKETFSYALRLTLFLTIPAMVGLMALGIPIISILFQRGVFSYNSTVETSLALYGFAIGLPAFAGVRIIVPVFYSLQDTKTPVKVAFVAMLTNVTCDLIFMYPLKQFGLSLATSLSACVNFAILAYILRKRIGRIGARRILASSSKVMAASISMGIAASSISMTRDWDVAGEIQGKLLTLTSGIFAGLFIFTLSSYLLKSEELLSVISLVRKRYKK